MLYSSFKRNMSHKNVNIDKKVIEDFGNEWSNFDQSTINNKELFKAFNQYFKFFQKLSDKNMEGFDMAVEVVDGLN